MFIEFGSLEKNVGAMPTHICVIKHLKESAHN